MGGTSGGEPKIGTMESKCKGDEGEGRFPGGENATRDVQGELSEQTAHARGNSRFILNDHSHHDNSKHHFGDVRESPEMCDMYQCSQS